MGWPRAVQQSRELGQGRGDVQAQLSFWWWELGQPCPLRTLGNIASLGLLFATCPQRKT